MGVVVVVWHLYTGGASRCFLGLHCRMGIVLASERTHSFYTENIFTFQSSFHGSGLKGWASTRLIRRFLFSHISSTGSDARLASVLERTI